jgi:hypothetical protein
MTDEDVYTFHQTPAELATALIATLPLAPTDHLYEPFRGEGAFYNNFPAENPKDWSEITQGRDYANYDGDYDWVITNPPFQIEKEGKRVNTFWYLLDVFTQKARKGIAFLGNDTCFSTLTPNRMKLLEDRGWSIQKLVVCSVKKWRGRYFFIVLERKPPGMFTALQGNF